MAVCSALGCTNTDQKGFLMKRFPKDPARRNIWVNNMKRSKWQPTDNCRICEIHFAPEMWERTRADGQRILRRNAVPTIFTFNETVDDNEDEDEEEEERRPKRRRTGRAVSRLFMLELNPNSSCSNSSNDVTEIQSTSKEASTNSTTNQGRVYNPFSLTTTTTTTTGINQNYPIHQDVRFSRLPFYDIVSELLKPSSLIPNSNHHRLEQTFNFGLTPQQTIDILHSKTVTSNYLCDFEVQIQLRLCLSETNCEQDDYYPPEFIVKVNNRVCALPPILSSTKPGTKLKQLSKPINITPYVKLTSTLMNCVTIIWANTNIGPGYTICINLVKKLTADDLVKRLKEKGVMNPDYTRSLIKEKLNDSDSEIVTTCLRVSLICPLGKMRMITPCRATTCNHLQCFDSTLFLQMNEKKSTWTCPVCDKSILYQNLIIDGYFKDVLTSSHLPSDINEIELHKDGTWSIHKILDTKNNCTNNDDNNRNNSRIDDSIEIICDDDDDDDDDDGGGDSGKISISKTIIQVNKNDQQPVEIIDLIDSDSDVDGGNCDIQQVTNLDIADGVISLDTSSSSSSSASSSSSSTSSQLSSVSIASYSPIRSPDENDLSSFSSLESFDDNAIHRNDEEFVISSSIIKIPIQEDVCSQSNDKISNLPTTTTNDLINNENENIGEISSTINHNDFLNYLPPLNDDNLQ